MDDFRGRREEEGPGEAGHHPEALPRADVELLDPDELETSSSPSRGLALPIGLFILTTFTTLWAGAYRTNENPFRGAWRFLMEEPAALWNGLPFAVTLMVILLTHEFGHFVLSKVHRVPASFPLFIPGPPHFAGTFGAVIRLRGPILNRKALFDIGVAGPIAGFVVALVAMIVGLRMSEVVTVHSMTGIYLGEPLVWQFTTWIMFGPLPPNSDVVVHPIALAAWIGLFLTSLNLIPIGQLDGGHVAYALWGDGQRRLALASLPILLALGFFGHSPTWLVLVGLAGLVGLGHPPVQDQGTVLGKTRLAIGWLAVVIFVLTFIPIPISIYK